MGAYTEFFFKVTLDSETPSSVINLLRYMTMNRLEDEECDLPSPLPDHPLFATNSWRSMLLAGPVHIFRLSEYSKGYELIVFTEFKCYNNEIKNFVNWVRPWVDKGPRSFLGHYCSEWDYMPVLIERTDTGILYNWGEDLESDDSPFRPE